MGGPVRAPHSSVVNGFCRSADGPQLKNSSPIMGPDIAAVTHVVNGFCRSAPGPTVKTSAPFMGPVIAPVTHVVNGFCRSAPGPTVKTGNAGRCRENEYCWYAFCNAYQQNLQWQVHPLNGRSRSLQKNVML